MDFIAEVVSRHKLKIEDAAAIVNKAKMFYYGLKYPCEPLASEDDKPIVSFRDQQWILAACEEFVETLGFNSAIGYRENGSSWTLDGAQLSNRLVSIIKPTIGVIK